MSSRLAVPLLLFLFVAACDNPTGVGSSLVDVGGGIPEVIPLQSTPLQRSATADSSGSSVRFLAGVTDDPDLGTIAATSYIDFTYPASRSDAFNNGSVASATLVLTRDYVYGDTTGTLSMRIRDLVDEWGTTGRRVDTTVTAGADVTAFDFATRTTTIEIPLPATWIARWDSTLRGTTLSSSFHGLALDAVAGNAVIGLNRASSALRVVSAGESVTYPVSKALTTLAFSGEPVVPTDRMLFQDGRHSTVAFAFDLANTDLRRAVISRATLSIATDTSLSSSEPAGYVRPPLVIARLDAIFSDPASRSELTLAILNEDGVFEFENDRLIRSVELNEDGTLVLDRFELRINAAENGLGVLLLKTGGPDALLPQLSLTVVRAD